MVTTRWKKRINAVDCFGERHQKVMIDDCVLLWVRIVGNKAGYTATPVACGWAGAIIEVSGAFGQEQ